MGSIYTRIWGFDHAKIAWTKSKKLRMTAASKRPKPVFYVAAKSEARLGDLFSSSALARSGEFMAVMIF